MPQLPYNDRPFIRFKGKFRDLIPQGWVFQKLYASNYRCYHKGVTALGPGGDSIRVWQHCGGYVELDNFLEHSYLFAQFLMDDEKVQSVKWEAERELVPGWGKEITSRDFFINLRDGYLIFPATFTDAPNFHLHSPTLTVEERKALRDEYDKEWRRVTVSKAMFDAALDFVRSGMSEIIVP